MTTITTDDESEAREWLHSAVTYDDFYGVAKDDKHRATILALLDAPRMPRPEDVPDEVLREMSATHLYSVGAVGSMRAALQVLYDHYTAPPPKVEAWAVVWPHYTAAFTDREDAEACAASGPQGAPCRIVKLVEAADE